MYTLRIKDDERKLDIASFRSLFFLAGLFAILGSERNVMSILVAVILFTAAAFVGLILLKFRLNKLLLSATAAILLLIATHNPVFPALILLLGLVLHYSYIAPVVEIDKDLIVVKKTFSNKKYPWQDFSNIVLKDNLLTLDFKNNKVVQLEIEESGVDEEEFNAFCREKLES